MITKGEDVPGFESCNTVRKKHQGPDFFGNAICVPICIVDQLEGGMAPEYFLGVNEPLNFQ